MPVEVPFTNRPEDIEKLLKKLPEVNIPTEEIGPQFLKNLGFSAASANQLFEVLKKLNFIDAKNRASAAWIAFVADEKRGLVLAAAVKQAYGYLFKEMLCPYLAADETLIDYFKTAEKATARELNFALQTFRALTESADFQEVLCEAGEPAAPSKAPETSPTVKVNPNPQFTIQVRIDLNTSDEKIETIFKNMRKYLLDKPGGE